MASVPRQSNAGRILAVAELIRMHGPHKAARLIAEADRAHAEGRLPDVARALGEPDRKENP